MGAEGTDAHLLARARAGDTEAYVSLFGRHHPEALATAADLAGPDAADDVIAEAFVRILACLDEGGGPRQTFSPYLGLTLHRAAVEHLHRDRGPADAAAVPEVSVLQPSDPRAVRTPELETFSRLTPRAQMALWLRDVDEVPTAEVGELLGVDAVVADQLARRAGAAFSAAHPGPLAPALLALHKPAVTTPVGVLTLVPPPAPTTTGAGVAGGVAARWRRWAPGVAAAAIVAIVASFAVTALGRGPVDETTQQEAAVAPPTVGQIPSFRDFDLHGGRIAPAMLGGLVNADVDEVATLLEESPEADETEAANGVEETDAHTPESTKPSAHATETPPARNDEPVAPEPPAKTPPETTTPKNVAISSTGVEVTGTRGGAIARFTVDNIASGGQFTITLTGEQAEIQSVSGGGDCTVQGKTATCTFAGGAVALLSVTVLAPQGGKISVRTERNDGSSASAAVDVPKPVEEVGDVEETPPTTPTGGTGDSSPDEVDAGN